MIAGTASHVGKTQIVAGLCRLLTRQGIRVAPFKAQNMALNSYVTHDGHEIGRAQAMQAFAAGTAPESAMNPILLKPYGERTSQVIVNGRPYAEMDARDYHAHALELYPVALHALQQLRETYDVVLVEGAGSAAEVNLHARDITNLRLAVDTDLPALIVGDIERGGVFAALYGTAMLLPADQRQQVRGFLINKFRGDPTILGGGSAELEQRCGLPTLGVLPWLDGLDIDAEDSLALPTSNAIVASVGSTTLDVAVVRFPHTSNVTDLDPLVCEPAVCVRYIEEPTAVGRPDLVVLPGTKATVEDLGWLRARRLDGAVATCGATILGICGGYQMLGQSITDTVESRQGSVPGLGLLRASTEFDAVKLTRQRTGAVSGLPVSGYQIHHGRVTGEPAWVQLHTPSGCEPEGATAPESSHRGPVFATTLHGILESDSFRTSFLQGVGRHSGKSFAPSGMSFATARSRQYDRVADAIQAHLDIAAIRRYIGEGRARIDRAGTFP